MENGKQLGYLGKKLICYRQWMPKGFRAWFSPESCLRKAAMVFRVGETVPGADLGFNSISLATVQRRDPGGGGQSVRPLQA